MLEHGMLETRYIDLSEEIARSIRAGVWTERLPGVIKLGKVLKADPATVLKALKVLEDKSLVTISGKKGTFITPPGEKPKHRVIGLIGIPTDAAQNYSTEFRAIEKNATKSGYRVVGISHNNELFVNDMDLLLQFPVDGYIFMYSSLTPEIAAFLKRKGMKFVACNNPVGIPGTNWVDIDSESVFRCGFEYLIKQGHRKIAYLEFFNPNYNYSGRIRSVCKEISMANGLAFNESLFISKNVGPYYKAHGESYLYTFGFECTKKLLTGPERPTAIIAINRQMGSGVRDALKKYDLRVPEDISIIIYFGQNEKEDFFSSVALDYERRAGIATDILMNLIENNSEDIRQELIIPDIVVRKSTSKYKG